MSTNQKGQAEAARRRAVPREQALISRRGFVGMLLATSAAFTGATVPLAAMASEEAKEAGEPALTPVPIARVEEVPPGESRRFSFPPVAKYALLINLPGEGLRAYSEECTHLGCAVYWAPEETRILCPCHKGVFDPTDGAPLAGPPRRPLGRIALEVRDGVIYAVGRLEA
ncbi:MAG: ubiquinol-cytochrome c reductase iron-sulfur subunit [Bacillota bacterium]